MEQPTADDSAVAGVPHRLSRDTTPTWEVELLISGVAVFAMLQLPGWLDDRLLALLPRFDETWAYAIKIGYVYLKTVAVILALTFALHLLLRARWIALVGMHSVYPQGILWNRLRMGPLQRRVEMAQSGDGAALIDRADNVATVVFAVGVMLASMMLMISLLVFGVFIIALAAATLSGGAFDPLVVAIVSSALILLPSLLARYVDKRFGARLPEGGAMQKALLALIRAYVRIGLFGRGANPVLALLASHGGERRTLLATTTVMALAVIIVALSLDALRDPMRVGNYAQWPRFADGSRTVASANYNDTRQPLRDLQPYIGSRVVEGDYLRLVVPYRASSDGAALRRTCVAAHSAAARRGGAVPGNGSAESDATRYLACLQRLHPVLLDGRPLAGLAYDVGSDPATDRPALVAMIDVRELAPGRHELRVGLSRASRDDVDDPSTSRIPFWR